MGAGPCHVQKLNNTATSDQVQPFKESLGLPRLVKGARTEFQNLSACRDDDQQPMPI